MKHIQIEDYIPVGKENAISRRDLEKLTGLDDRQNRILILKARKKKIPILASERGGYYISYDIDEIELFLRKIKARERSMARDYEPLRELVRLKKGIVVTTVREHVRRIGTQETDENQLKIQGVG